VAVLTNDLVSRIYVTGVAGMIGSNLASRLLDDGFNVVGIDNLWRGKRENVEPFLAKPNFSFFELDVVNDDSWAADMGERDVLIHVADIVAGIGYVFAKEWEVFRSNLLINTAIAKVVADKKPERLIYLGTACSYPQGLQRSVSNSQLREDQKIPADPESGYGWSKLLGEIEFSLAVKNINTRCITLDLHNVYGWPCIYKDATSQVIPSLIYRALKAEDDVLTVWGDGSQGRAFLHVSDVVAAIVASLTYEGQFNNFMIGPDHCTTIGEIAKLLVNHELLPVSRVAFDTSKPTGDIGRYANFDRAMAELGWTPQADLSSEIEQLVWAIANDQR
jgi:nucleoside-diphosphate-sugar epimerase